MKIIDRISQATVERQIRLAKSNIKKRTEYNVKDSEKFASSTQKRGFAPRQIPFPFQNPVPTPNFTDSKVITMPSARCRCAGCRMRCHNLVMPFGVRTQTQPQSCCPPEIEPIFLKFRPREALSSSSIPEAVPRSDEFLSQHRPNPFAVPGH